MSLILNLVSCTVCYWSLKIQIQLWTWRFTAWPIYLLSISNLASVHLQPWFSSTSYCLSVKFSQYGEKAIVIPVRTGHSQRSLLLSPAFRLATGINHWETNKPSGNDPFWIHNGKANTNRSIRFDHFGIFDINTMKTCTQQLYNKNR